MRNGPDVPPAEYTPGITIEAANLGKRFNREWIFRSLTRSFLPGNTYAITGPNGSGKSTLLQVLWGQVPPSDGTITYTRNGDAVPAEEIYRHIAIAAPYMELIDEFTLTELLRFHFSLRPLRNQISIPQLLNILYLEKAANEPIVNFSSGMKQRVKLALAFYTQADVVFLDEPGTNLDKQAFSWYREELARLPKETIVFIASNNPEEYPSSANQLYIPDLKGQTKG